MVVWYLYQLQDYGTARVAQKVQFAGDKMHLKVTAFQIIFETLTIIHLPNQGHLFRSQLVEPLFNTLFSFLFLQSLR